jgi:hypothetical protein
VVFEKLGWWIMSKNLITLTIHHHQKLPDLVFKLLSRSVIFPQQEIIDLIQIFSQLSSVYQTSWVSTRLVWYSQKSPAPKFGPLNLSSTKRGSVKLRRCGQIFWPFALP